MMPLANTFTGFDGEILLAANNATGTDSMTAKTVPKNAICTVSRAGCKSGINTSHAGGNIHPIKSTRFG